MAGRLQSEYHPATSRDRYRQEVLRTQISWEGKSDVANTSQRLGSLRSTRAGSPQPGSPSRRSEQASVASPRTSPQTDNRNLSAVPQLHLFEESRSGFQPGSPRGSPQMSPRGGPLLSPRSLSRNLAQGDKLTEKVTAVASAEPATSSSSSQIVAPWARDIHEQNRLRKGSQQQTNSPERNPGRGDGTMPIVQTSDSRRSPGIVAPWAREPDRMASRRIRSPFGVPSPPESWTNGNSKPDQESARHQSPAGDYRNRVPLDFSDCPSLDSLALSPRGPRPLPPRAEGLGTHVAGRRAARELTESRGLWRDLPVYSTSGRVLERTGLDNEFPMPSSVRSRSASPVASPVSNHRQMRSVRCEVADVEVAAGMRPNSQQKVVKTEQRTSSQTQARAQYLEHMNVNSDGKAKTKHDAGLSPKSDYRSLLAEGSPVQTTRARLQYIEDMSTSFRASSQHAWQVHTAGAAQVDASPVLPAWMTHPSQSQNSATSSRDSAVMSPNVSEKVEAWRSFSQKPREKPQPETIHEDVASALENVGDAVGDQDTLKGNQSRQAPQGRLNDETLFPLSASDANCSPERRRDFHNPMNTQELGRQKVPSNTSVHPVLQRKSPLLHKSPGQRKSSEKSPDARQSAASRPSWSLR